MACGQLHSGLGSFKRTGRPSAFVGEEKSLLRLWPASKRRIREEKDGYTFIMSRLRELGGHLWWLRGVCKGARIMGRRTCLWVNSSSEVWFLSQVPDLPRRTKGKHSAGDRLHSKLTLSSSL